LLYPGEEHKVVHDANQTLQSACTDSNHEVFDVRLYGVPGSTHKSTEPTDMSSIRRIISGGPMVWKHPKGIDKPGLCGSNKTLLFVEVPYKYTNGMKRDTVPARPLAGARVDGGNDGQSEPRQEETLSARKVECKTCQPVRSTVLQSSSVVPTTPNQSEPMHRSGAGAKVPSSQSGHATTQQGHVQHFKAPNQIYHTLRDSVSF